VTIKNKENVNYSRKMSTFSGKSQTVRTGNMGEDNKPWEMMGLGLPESGHYPTDLFSPRERALLIRPVCEY
jgi:hypothetical protein